MIDAVEFSLIHRQHHRTTDLMTMADGGYDPMGHIQTGRPQAYYLYQVAAAALEQQQQLQQLEQQQQQQQRQQQQLQQQQQQAAAATAAAAAAAATAAATADPQESSEIGSNSTPPRSSPPSEDGHENNNNLPAAANNNLFRTEQHKKHKRKRLSAVLDKLHNGGSAVVNHNNNNVGEGQPFKLKCTDSRSSAEDSAAEDVFPYSASPRISISPLRLSEVDENQPLQQQQQQRLPAVKQEAGALASATQLIIPPHGYDQQLPSPSQLHQAKLEAQLQRLTPLQPTQIKQEQQDPQQLYKQLQYFNPLALFNCLPEPTKLLYQEFARQRSHSDSDLQQQQPQQQQQQQHKKQQGQARQQSTKQPSKKKRLNGGKATGAGAASQQRQRPPTSSSRCSNASSNGAPHDPQEHPLDLSMKSTGSGSGMSLLDSPSLLASPVIKQEPKLADSPPPPPPPPSRDSPLPALQPPPPKLIVKREDCRDRRRSSPYEQLNGYGHHHGATVTGGPGSGPGGAPGFNLNVSPVVEEMPPGSDVAYMCPVCGQLFSLQDRLAKHMASRHKSRTGPTDITKSYMCEVCHRSFARSDMLTRHMRLHTGVKPYSCKVCGQIFSRSDHLSTHQRTHTGEKPYKCPQCPYAACRRDMITRHMRTHTRYDSQRGGGGLGGGIGIGPGGDGGSPLMDQKPLLLPMVSLGTGRSMKKQVSFGGVPTSYVLEANTES
ncbi:zinc finger protein 853 [Anopheles darlingi]|uniref:zinc finger protein 853 n=1 Tax=Anopheles darlingi TaxID=43151 RepID=UPI00210049EF|nr:zinc finger protein 853 [Anopheles darlingi]